MGIGVQFSRSNLCTSLGGKRSLQYLCRTILGYQFTRRLEVINSISLAGTHFFVSISNSTGMQQ
jgi:hypothetical protein